MGAYEANDDYPLTVLTSDNLHGRMLSVLVEADEPVTQSEIAERADVSQPAVYRAMRKLVERGIVTDLDGTWGFELNTENEVAELLVLIHDELCR